MTCPGSGKPVFIDYAGPGVPGGYPKCSDCGKGTAVVGPGWTMPEHEREPQSGRQAEGSAE